MSNEETAPKRIQALFGLLRDIQRNDSFRDKYGKEQAKEIIQGLQKRLLTARDESASLVFGCGKLGNTVGGGEGSTLNQTLRNIEVDMMALRRNQKGANEKVAVPTQEDAVDAVAVPTQEDAADATAGAEDEESSDDSSSSEADETTETSTESNSGDTRSIPIRFRPPPSKDDDIPQDCQESNDTKDEDVESLLIKERKRNAHLEYLNKALESKVQAVEAQKLKMRQTDRKVEISDQADAVATAAAQDPHEKEDLLATLSAERKRIAHLEDLNNTLESKVQTIEAAKLELVKQLETAAAVPPRHEQGATQGAVDSPSVKKLEEKLQHSVASLEIFKSETGNLHQEILQLRNKVTHLTKEAGLKDTAVSNLKTLNRELEHQLTQMAKDKGLSSNTLEKEKAQSMAVKAELDKLAKSKSALAEKLKSLKLSHETEMETMVKKLQSSEQDLNFLREELARESKQAGEALFGLEQAKSALMKEREARKHESHELKEVINHQRSSIQKAETDYVYLETELREIILQQRNDLKIQAETLKSRNAKRLEDDSELLKQALNEKLQALNQKHMEAMAEREERHLEHLRKQESSMNEKLGELERLLQESRELNNTLESKLQKSREDNARCLSLVVKLGKKNLEHGGETVTA